MSRTLTKRERVLATIVGAVAVVFLNVFVIDYFLRNQRRLRSELASQSKQVKTMQTVLAEKPMWEQREAWLRGKQPKITNEDTAGGQLLEQVRELAKKHAVVLNSPELRVPTRRPEYTSISVEIDAKCPWKSLLAFLRELQAPEQFIVLETANLKRDAADQTQMLAHLRIAKWFAPQ